MADNKVEIKITADAALAIGGLNAVKQEFGAVGQKGGATADQIDAAWAVLGTKSFAQVKNEIARVNAALEVVKATTKNPLEIKAATDAARAKIQSLEDGVKKTAQAAGGLGDVFSKLGPIIGAAFTGREFVQTIVSAESLKLGLTAILGSSQAAAAELAFLKKTSNELGLELQSAGQQYLSLTAATKGTALEGEQTRQVFTAVTRAMSVLGKSSAETERALQAVSQMASKGTVSMEELRGQLGEALPGALKAAADGAGITTSQLIKMVENGDVLAKDLLPALAKGLDAIYANGGPPDTLIANWNRFKNTITETSTELGESGLTRALTDVAIVGTKIAGGLGAGFVGVGKSIGEVAGAVATLNIQPLAEDLHMVGFAGQEFEAVMADAMGNTIGVVQKLPPALEMVGKTAEATGNKGQEAFRKMEIAAQNAATSVIANRQLYTDREEAIKKSLEVAEKAVKASESEAKVLNLVANAFGSETEKRQAATLASQLQEQAQNQLILVKRVELDIAQQKLAQLVNETRGVKELDAATKTQKEQLEQSVKVKTEEVRASQAQGKAYEVTTTQLKAAAEAFKDNSSRVYELRAAMVAATEAAARKREEFAKGKATTEQVTAADLDAKNATYLYRDALNDLVTALKIKEATLTQQAATRQKELDLNIEEKTTTLELARARGDEAGAAAAQTLVTQASVAAKREAADANRAQAQSARDSADAEESAAKAAGNLTTEKRAQIEAMRESAKQKDLDAQKTDLLASREERLAKATLATAAAIDKAAEAERKRLSIDKEGFSTDKAGNRIVASESQTQLNQRVAGNYGADLATDERAIRASNIKLQLDQIRTNGAYGSANSPEVTALLAERSRLEGELSAARQGKSTPASSNDGLTAEQRQLKAAGAQPGETITQANQRNAGATAPATSNTYLVKIDLGNGRTSNVNVASANDAQTLISALQSAKSAAGH